MGPICNCEAFSHRYRRRLASSSDERSKPRLEVHARDSDNCGTLNRVYIDRMEPCSPYCAELVRKRMEDELTRRHAQLNFEALRHQREAEQQQKKGTKKGEKQGGEEFKGNNAIRPLSNTARGTTSVDFGGERAKTSDSFRPLPSRPPTRVHASRAPPRLHERPLLIADDRRSHQTQYTNTSFQSQLTQEKVSKRPKVSKNFEKPLPQIPLSHNRRTTSTASPYGQKASHSSAAARAAAARQPAAGSTQRFDPASSAPREQSRQQHNWGNTKAGKVSWTTPAVSSGKIKCPAPQSEPRRRPAESGRILQTAAASRHNKPSPTRPAPAVSSLSRKAKKVSKWFKQLLMPSSDSSVEWVSRDAARIERGL